MNETSTKLQERVSFDITDDLDFERLLTMFEIVIVDVWAHWCEPCKKIASRYEGLGEKYNEYIKEKRLILLKDDIDFDGSIHREHIEAVPTFFIYYKTKMYKKISGTDFNDLDGIIEQLLRGEGEFQVEQNDEEPQSYEGV
jgi:thiol-disulfide isomerase/thioredoxin